ncbi:hypothetical protein [Mycobacterium avium]|nr:hypothetical protein [Mycobacterium avium]QBC16833.1 hypothetical protein BJP78_23800 [Mycobacterium avium subsp. hominissuis]
MNRSIALVAAALSIVPAIVAPAPATADPDPHMPDVRIGYCPGGRGSKPIQLMPGASYGAVGYYCNGVPYADGSFWRYVNFPVPASMLADPQQNASYGLHCVTSDEFVQASMAPPGGCDGAV